MQIYDVYNYEGNVLKSGEWEDSFSPEERKQLVCEAPVEIIDILPTGEIYVTQLEYRKKLSEIFGVGNWSLIPKSPYFESETERRQLWSLEVRGRVIAYAWGEDQVYVSDRGKSTFAAPEVIKSNALMRLTKDLLLFHNLWNKKFIEEFKSKYCESYTRNNTKTGRQEEYWRLKSSKTSAPANIPQTSPLPSQTSNTNVSPGKFITATLVECSLPGEKGKAGKILWEIPNYGKLETTFFNLPMGVDYFEELKSFVGKELEFSYRINGKWHNLVEVHNSQRGVENNEDLIAARDEVDSIISSIAKEHNMEKIAIWQQWGKVGKEDLHTLDECSHIVWELEKKYGVNN